MDGSANNVSGRVSQWSNAHQRELRDWQEDLAKKGVRAHGVPVEENEVEESVDARQLQPHRLVPRRAERLQGWRWHAGRLAHGMCRERAVCGHVLDAR